MHPSRGACKMVALGGYIDGNAHSTAADESHGNYVPTFVQHRESGLMWPYQEEYTWDVVLYYEMIGKSHHRDTRASRV